MSENTKIEWADHTFNPWEGCQRVGPGCDNCYEARNSRFGGGTAPNWGPGAPRRRTSVANWRLPIKWNAGAAAFQAAHGRRQRVFCASLADVFDNEVDPQWRADLLNLIADTPNLDWLLLTKRIGNAKDMLDAFCASDGNAGETWSGWPNVWLGATIVSQEEADRDIPKLLSTPAAKRFLSIEPLLGPVDISQVPGRPGDICLKPLVGLRWVPNASGGCKPTSIARIDWVIAGGESGPGARPSHPLWFRNLRDQCMAAGVAFLFKQWGEWLPINLDDCYGRRCTVPSTVNHMHGSTHAVTEPMAILQGTEAMITFKVGKKAAGRLLDGVEHNGVPS